MVGKRRAVDRGHPRLDLVPSGTCELRERSWQVVDRCVTVAYEEHTGARREVARIPAARSCGKCQHKKESQGYRHHGRERADKAMSTLVGTA